MPSRNLKNWRPRLETLEDRTVPAAIVDFVPGSDGTTGGVLTITGDSGQDNIVIDDDGANVSVSVNGEAAETFTGVSEINIDTGNQADEVHYNLTATPVEVTPGDDTTPATTADPSVGRVVTVVLGNQHDLFEANLTGNVGAGSAIDFDVSGGNGKDTIRVEGDAVGFAGDDTTTTETEGSAGAWSFDGGNGKDLIDIAFAGSLGGSLTIDATGGNGPDSLSFALTAESGSTGGATVNLSGGNGPDSFDIALTDNTLVDDDGDPATPDVSTLGGVELNVDGGHGPDNVTMPTTLTGVNLVGIESTNGVKGKKGKGHGKP